MNEHTTPWRLYLALGALAGLGLLLVLLWPAARALAQAVTAAIEANGDLVVGVLFGFGAMLLVGVVRILFAIGKRFEAQAKQARVVTMQNQQPVLIDDLQRYADQSLSAALLAWSAKQQAEAERSQYPNLSSYSYHVRNDPTPPLLEAEPVVAPPIDLDPRRPLFEQLESRGIVCRSGRSLHVGMSENGPEYVELAGCSFIGIVGQPRKGKTTLAMYLLAQAAAMDFAIVLCDPHLTKETGLMNRCQPISGATIRQATTPAEIADAIAFADKIGRARINGDADRRPVLLVIDELSNLVARQQLPAETLAALAAMSMEYAGVGVHGILIGHDWSQRMLGPLGAILRRMVTHRLICRSDAQAAELLLPTAAIARIATTLQPGRALFWGDEAPILIGFPELQPGDLVYAGRKRPPRPYTARPIALAATPAPVAQPPVAPTEHVAPRQSPIPAPPTAHLSPTIQEQITELLSLRGTWLTASEIAAALQIDVQSVRTLITPLVDVGQVARRDAQRRGRDRYEYASGTINQSINASVTLSA